MFYEIAHRLSSSSIRAYLDHVVINSSPEPRRFRDVEEWWQRDVYASLTPALESVAGLRDGYDGPTSFFFTLPRGHDKTTGLGRVLNWGLAYSPRYLSMVVGSGDKDQAGFIREYMQGEARLNPWLEKRVTHHQNIVKGPGGLLKILTSDAGTNWGLNPDIVIAEEITHWKKRDLWDVLWSAREKRPGSIFIIIANAGIRGSWQHDILRKAQEDPSWHVYEAPGMLASWMQGEKVERLRAMLPRGLARRVLDNIWVDAAEGSDFLTRAEVEVCEALGRMMGLGYRATGRKGIRYVAAIDYGPKRDRTVLVVGHLEGQVVVVDRLDVWQGSPDSPIQLAKVEEWLEEVNKTFHYPDLVLDPYQMEGIAQKYEMRQIVERFEARGGKNTYALCENFRTLIVNKRLAVYPGAGLLVVDGRQESFVDEALGLVLKPTPYGYRFDHEAGFHDDRSVAVGMMSLHLLRQDPSGPGVAAVPVSQESFQEKMSKILKGERVSPAVRRGLWGL